MAHVQLVSLRTPKSFSSKLFPASMHQHVLVHGIIPAQVEDLVFPFLGLNEVPIKPFLQSVRVPLNCRTPWCISYSSHFCIFCENLLRVHSVASFRTLMKKSNSINPWGKPGVTDLRVDFVLLFTTLHITDCN